MDPLPLTLRSRFSPNLNSHFLKFWRSSHHLSDYVYSHFYDHLCAATTVFLSARNITDDHPAVEILHDLENTAYLVDENLSEYYSILTRYIIQAILRWLSMLNCRLKVGAPYVL